MTPKPVTEADIGHALETFTEALWVRAATLDNGEIAFLAALGDVLAADRERVESKKRRWWKR